MNDYFEKASTDLNKCSVSYFSTNFITFVKVIRSGKKTCDLDRSKM